MQLLEMFTGGGGNTPSPAAASSTPNTAGAATPAAATDNPWPSLPSYNDYRDEAKSAGFWQGIANADPRGILGGIAGMVAGSKTADLNAAGNYFKMLQGRTATQNGQLDTAQTMTFLNRYRAAQGLPPIDPNNVQGSYAATGPQAAASAAPQSTSVPQAPVAPLQASAAPPPGAIAPSPGGGGALDQRAFLSRTATTMPTIPAAITAPAGPSVSPPPSAAMPGNQADALRAFYASTAAAMAGLPKFAQTALDFTKMAQTGAPAGTVALPNGQLADAATGRPIGMTVQEYNARGAGLTATADANARVPAAETIAANQAALDRGTAAVKAGFDFSHTVTRMGTDGQLHAVPVSALELAKGKSATPLDATPNAGVNTYPIADNPYRADQQKDATTAATNADQATQGQAGVQQLGAAIKAFGMQGPWAQKTLGVLENLNQARLLSPDLVKKVQSGELANMDSNTLVGEMVRQMINSRVPVSIYNQTAKNKPGLANSDPTLQLEALNQDFQRVRDRNAFLPQFYQAHPFAMPAEAQDAFNKANPIDRYESRVLPLAMPKTQAQAKPGYAYSVGGRPMVWDGAQFQPYARVGE